MNTKVSFQNSCLISPCTQHLCLQKCPARSGLRTNQHCSQLSLIIQPRHNEHFQRLLTHLNFPNCQLQSYFATSTMRLLNTTTLMLEEFWDNSIPPYAILSHTWEKDEITLQEFQAGKQDEMITRKAGFVKVRNFVELARQYDYAWVWIDTCCIDKTSSSELSEAINSMFRWYQSARICFTYWFDYHLDRLSTENQKEFSSCKWLTRGWTLQELIAPEIVVFLNSAWKPVGEKRPLADMISSLTHIHVRVFRNHPLSNFSLAQRMSWAAERVTTRVEDEAYCLLGLFNINMALQYGEGRKLSSGYKRQLWCAPRT